MMKTFFGELTYLVEQIFQSEMEINLLITSGISVCLSLSLSLFLFISLILFVTQRKTYLNYSLSTAAVCINQKDMLR